MPAFGLALPIVPGKEQATVDIIGYIRTHLDQYEQSRRKAGITLERVYVQRNPDGRMLLIPYSETDTPLEQVFKHFTSSTDDFDRWFLRQNEEVTGIPFSQAGPPPVPEHVAHWAASGTYRGRGLAFAAPLLPGKAEAARAWAHEAFVTRKADLDESRQSLKSTREEVFLNRTPMGDIAVVYIEAEDPVRANQQFAASRRPFDRWFKDRLKEVFPPQIDFDQPVPTNEEIWDWRR
jgi:hypothetical protein